MTGGGQAVVDKDKQRSPIASEWTFLSNHAHVLLCIAREPEIRLRDVAERVGITERAVQRIVADLEAGQYLERARSGRRNRYEVHPELSLRHPIEAHRDVGALLALVLEPEDPPVQPAKKTSSKVPHPPPPPVHGATKGRKPKPG
jgi:hypothetical protein